MGLRKLRKKFHLERKQADKRYERYCRLNKTLATPGKYPLTIVLDHLKASYNVAKIFRSADAFGIQEVHLVGIGCFDPAPSMGSFKWVPAVFHDSFQSCYDMLVQNEYSLFTLEPEGTNDILSHTLPLKSALIFGHEEYGISFEKSDYPEIQTLHIPQIGKVQSLNVSVAASIAMYEYFRQHGEVIKDKGDRKKSIR